MEKIVPSNLLAFKAYDIKLHTIDTNEFQELASKFEEKVRQSLARMMDIYEKSIYDIQRYLQWTEINFKDEHLVHYAFFQEHEEKYELIKPKV